MSQPAPRPHFLPVLQAAPTAGATVDDAPDRQLENQIRRNLNAAGFVQLRRIDVAVDSGHATLSGQVARFYLKQLAQNAALSIDGITGIESRITVSE